jgi:hypothetical protein
MSRRTSISACQQRGRRYFSGSPVAVVLALLHCKFLVRGAYLHFEQALDADRLDVSVEAVHVFELRAN